LNSDSDLYGADPGASTFAVRYTLWLTAVLSTLADAVILSVATPNGVPVPLTPVTLLHPWRKAKQQIHGIQRPTARQRRCANRAADLADSPALLLY